MAKNAAKSTAKRGKDGDLFAALVKQAKNYRDRVPAFQIEQPSVEKSLARAAGMLSVIWPFAGDCSPFLTVNNGAMAQMRLSDDGRVDVFHPSGAIAGLMRPPAARKPIASDERKVDRKPFLDLAEKIARAMAIQYSGPEDKLQFESKWEWKGWGVTVPQGKNHGGEKTPVALFEVLSAFRRYLHGLPVLGRASIHVSVGAGQTITRWGVDWREVRSKPLTQTAVIDPEEGAKRVLDDLWWRRPERPFTLEDFEPRSFQLGYISFSRRQEQFVMQPVWVAILSPRGGTSMGQVVAVPAAPRAFEPICRPARVPLVA